MPQIHLGVPGVPGVPGDRAFVAPPPQRLIGSIPRLLSLDVFRGLVILAMLLVNNLGDGETTGYFWKHADWPAMRQRDAWRAWWGYAARLPGGAERTKLLPLERYRLESQLGTKRVQLRLITRTFDTPRADRLQFEVDQLEEQLRALDEEAAMAAAPWRRIPLFTYCTLADFVMPGFMLIIGVAIPFSVAASRMRGMSSTSVWTRALRRAFLLILLGWILCYFRDQFAPSLYEDQAWTFTLGMDVLQLLGIAYLVARIAYELPMTGRIFLATLLLAWHWSLLRFGPQGANVPAGTFTRNYEAVGYAYTHWPVWERMTLHLLGNRLTIGWKGLLSVPPAAATMLIGTIFGEWLRHDDVEAEQKVSRLALWGVLLALIGFCWAFDVPLNEPRWSASYLLSVSGVGGVVLAAIYAIVDIHKIRAWAYPAIET